jgi:hypothetical protein
MLDPGKNHAQFGLAAFLVGAEFSRLSRNWSIYLSTVSGAPSGLGSWEQRKRVVARRDNVAHGI